MINSYIFRNGLLKDYAVEFNNYAIKSIYGSNILIGNDIEDDYKDLPPEGE